MSPGTKANPSEMFLDQIFENSQFLSACSSNLVLSSSHKNEVLVGNSSVQNHLPKSCLHWKQRESFLWDFNLPFYPFSPATLLSSSAPRCKSCHRGRTQSPNHAQPRESWKGRDLYINCSWLCKETTEETSAEGRTGKLLKN